MVILAKPSYIQFTLSPCIIMGKKKTQGSYALLRQQKNPSDLISSSRKLPLEEPNLYLAAERSMSPKTKSNSAAIITTKSPLKAKSGPSRMLHEAADFRLRQGYIPSRNYPKSLAQWSSRHPHFLSLHLDQFIQGPKLIYLRQWKSKFKDYMDLLIGERSPPS